MAPDQSPKRIRAVMRKTTNERIQPP